MKKFSVFAAFAILFAAMSFAAFAQTKADKPYHYEPTIPNVEARDTVYALFIGNSFTFYFDTYSLLKEIAASQGHCLQFKAAFVGGYSFARHLNDPKTYAAIESFRPYDYVFLQNQSQLNAQYGRDPKRHALALQDARELVARVRQYSPDAKIFLEATWASDVNTEHFLSKEDFDRCMWKGTAAMAKSCKTDVSPIGKAFAIARADSPDVKLLYKDKHHQSLAGAYLKACVNYLMIYGEDFDGKVSDCTLPAQTAAAMREAARKTVFRRFGESEPY